MYNPQLDTFIRVAEVGSFNKAAEEMFISTPVVRQFLDAVGALEF